MMHERLAQLLQPVVQGLGYELVLLEFQPSGRQAVLRLYIDSPAEVNLDDCERVSREVAAILDVEDPISQRYQLEVSSPGLDRPLVKPEHFERFSGEVVQVQLRHAVAATKHRYRGVLSGFREGMVVLETTDGIVRFPLADVERARLVPTF